MVEGAKIKCEMKEEERGNSKRKKGARNINMYSVYTVYTVYTLLIINTKMR